MNQLLSIVDDKLVVDRLQVKNTEGNLTHTGDITVLGSAIFAANVQLAKDVEVRGTLTVDTINAKNIVTNQNSSSTGSLDFSETSEAALDGKGLNFTVGNITNQFIYKEGGKLWSTLNVDLAPGKAFFIENLPVLTLDTLGNSVTKSNLRKVGTLKSLEVAGAAKIGEWAYFNPVHQRLGINTDSPSGAITIVENNVELVLSSYKINVAYVGTYNNTDLELGTDNTARVTLKNTGEVVIGHPSYKNGILKINGRLEVDEIITNKDKAINESLIFTATDTSDIYGTGIFWNQGRNQSQISYAANPNRIISSESFDLADEKYFSINGQLVLSKTKLGDGVTSSKLTSVGTLSALSVGGLASIKGPLVVGSASNIVINDSIRIVDDNSFKLSSNQISFKQSFAFACADEEEFKITSSGPIVVGNENNTSRLVNVYGNLSVGIKNPDADVAFTVGGPVNLNGMKFTKGDKKPTAGMFRKGDICWNTDPKATDFIGWVCVRAGTPGDWMRFGQIASN
jgi:hypothetical protein